WIKCYFGRVGSARLIRSVVPLKDHKGDAMRRMTTWSFSLTFALTALVAAQEPIIDVHVHAYPALPRQSDPIWQSVPEHPALRAPAGAAEHLDETLRQMERHNIVLAVLSGPDAAVRTWQSTAPGRFIGGAWLFFDDEVRPSVEDLRRSI